MGVIGCNLCHTSGLMLCGCILRDHRLLLTGRHLSTDYLAGSQYNTRNFVPRSSASTGHGWGIWTCLWVYTHVMLVTSSISGARILGCERCRFVFVSEVVFKRLDLWESRNLCLEIENGRYSKKRSKVGNICFIRRISSV